MNKQKEGYNNLCLTILTDALLMDFKVGAARVGLPPGYGAMRTSGMVHNTDIMVITSMDIMGAVLGAFVAHSAPAHAFLQ
jgi:hypothetical protein